MKKTQAIKAKESIISGGAFSVYRSEGFRRNDGGVIVFYDGSKLTLKGLIVS